MAWVTENIKGRPCIGCRTTIGEEVIWYSTLKLTGPEKVRRTDYGITVSNTGVLRVYFDIRVRELTSKQEKITRIYAQKSHITFWKIEAMSFNLVKNNDVFGDNKVSFNWVEEGLEIVLSDNIGQLERGIFLTQLETKALQTLIHRHAKENWIKYATA